MRIYIASSWKNPYQQHVVTALRATGHDVYDFRNPTPGDHGFDWRQCATSKQLQDPRAFRDEVLYTLCRPQSVLQRYAGARGL